MRFDPNDPIPQPDKGARERAEARQAQLTKPPGSLGELESIALQFAAWQGSDQPVLDNVCVRIFAADHGVCAQGISLFPQEVTRQMLHNFSAGGAAISVLARQQNFDFAVWNMGTVVPTDEMPGVKNLQIAPGTVDFTQAPALTEDQLAACLQAGAEAVTADCQLFIAGEMGIGNTTSAAAMMAALYHLDGARVAGSGTGLDEQGVAHKAEVIDRGLTLHRPFIKGPIDVLKCFGGLEIAAIVGAFLSAAQQRKPILVDGFITSMAAACAQAFNPDVRHWMLFAHCSAEQAHAHLLEQMQARPLLSLGMRLGEGSGAAVTVPLIRSALQLHAEMATFADAGVSDREAQ